MKKKCLIGFVITTFVLVGCKLAINRGPESDNPQYEDKEVNVYRSVGKVDKRISLRYYAEQPNVPFIAVNTYFKEFYNTDIYVEKNEETYKYYLATFAYLGFDAKQDLLFAQGLHYFNSHPDFISSKTKLFIHSDGEESTAPNETVVNLKNYSIHVYDDGNNAYVPISLLGKLCGGMALYNVSYNGKDIYVLDRNGQLGEVLTPDKYGSEYYSVLSNITEARNSDMALYNYNELCFAFDNLRGYTKQLVFGDNNLISLGLNGLLERYAPKVKEYLLSVNKEDYFEGLSALFSGLYDGGHTGVLSGFEAYSTAKAKESEQVFVDLKTEASNRSLAYGYKRSSTFSSRSTVFGTDYSNVNYIYNSTYKTSYITFNNFNVDYKGWDDFYNGKGSVPVATDTYAFVRSKLYQAKADGAKNVVIDLTTNTGGDSYALEGVVGLLNGAKSDFHNNDTFNKKRNVEKHSIDINLDGEFNEADIAEANSFNFNIGILTSAVSFSCGNLLPSTLKGLGYKILGEKSGGGSCAIAVETTADGIEYVRSSYVCLCDESGNNIDGGVEVDLEIEHAPLYPSYHLENYNKFYDMEFVSNYLSSAYL